MTTTSRYHSAQDATVATLTVRLNDLAKPQRDGAAAAIMMGSAAKALLLERGLSDVVNEADGRTPSGGRSALGAPRRSGVPRQEP